MDVQSEKEVILKQRICTIKFNAMALGNLNYSSSLKNFSIELNHVEANTHMEIPCHILENEYDF